MSQKWPFKVYRDESRALTGSKVITTITYRRYSLELSNSTALSKHLERIKRDNGFVPVLTFDDKKLYNTLGRYEHAWAYISRYICAL